MLNIGIITKYDDFNSESDYFSEINKEFTSFKDSNNVNVKNIKALIETGDITNPYIIKYIDKNGFNK